MQVWLGMGMELRPGQHVEFMVCRDGMSNRPRSFGNFDVGREHRNGHFEVVNENGGVVCLVRASECFESMDAFNQAMRERRDARRRQVAQREG